MIGKSAFLAFAILASANGEYSGVPICKSGPVADGLPVIYCPEQWNTGELSRPIFEAPMLRPDFRERVLVPPRRMMFRPKRDVTE